MRLFIALEVPEEVRSGLATLRDTQGVRRGLGQYWDAASWVAEPKLHVTVKFLGEVADSRMLALTDALAEIERVGEIGLVPEGILLFPPRRPVRVVGAGLGGDVGRLQLLFRAVERKCDSLGYPLERRPYCPHITLARSRTPFPQAYRFELTEMLSKGLPGQHFIATQFTLMQSHLQAGGSTYHRLASFPMAT